MPRDELGDRANVRTGGARQIERDEIDDRAPDLVPVRWARAIPPTETASARADRDSSFLVRWSFASLVGLVEGGVNALGGQRHSFVILSMSIMYLVVVILPMHR